LRRPRLTGEAGQVGRRLRVLLVVPAALLLAGCGSKQDALEPAGGPAKRIASLWWWMMGGLWVGLAVVCAILVAAWFRRDRPGVPFFRDPDRTGWAVVLSLGFAVPIIGLAGLFVYGDVFVIRSTAAPAKRSTSLTVEVIGHQWWWEVRYPGTSVVTANEIHIPARTRVNVEVRTDDVIHSFWVPQLNKKIDTLPEQTNRLLLVADKRGRYRGQCAEFCGLQHAKMGLYVFADDPAGFQRWIAREARPSTPSRSQGARVFAANCATCHTIRGTSARGRVGPDLTHLMSRETLAALATHNTRADLRRWVEDPQAIKPGNQMPALPLSSRQLDQVVAYLETLR
jgi:cytochrome c oxidase subunit II